MWHEQRKLAREWDAHRVSTPAHPRVVNDGLVRVEIPKADVDAIVVDGVTRKELAVGPGHMPTTPMPGEIGNAVISAHRDTFFRKIGDLRKGDEVLVRRDGEIFHFTFDHRLIVLPTDLSVIRPTSDAELTLITCYPTYFIGPAPERLVVVSKLVSREPDYGTQTASAAGH